jgi:hypothetical protein
MPNIKVQNSNEIQMTKINSCHLVVCHCFDICLPAGRQEF